MTDLRGKVQQTGYTESGGLVASDSKLGEESSYTWTDRGSLASVDESPVSWDGRLLTAMPGAELSYDEFGKLSTLVQGETETSYTYDSRGNRLSETTGESTSEYSWNELDQLISLDDQTFSYGFDGIRTQVGDQAQVYDQSLKLLADGETKYLWSPSGELLAQSPLESMESAQTQQIVSDHMGSVYEVLDSNGAVLSEYSYSAFGERTLTYGEDLSVMGFTSEQHDTSGLIYRRHRYYDPTAGQFISVDPMVATTMDPYGYADGNPLQIVDPLGLFSWDNAMANLGTGATWIGVGATILAFTPIGAPIAATLGFVTTVATGVSFLTSTYAAVRNCDSTLRSTSCRTSLFGIGTSIFSFTKPMQQAFKFATGAGQFANKAFDAMRPAFRVGLTQFSLLGGAVDGFGRYADYCDLDARK